MNDENLTISDSSLIDLVIQGDQDAFATLYERYSRYVYSLLTRHAPYQEVHELSQEVFMKVYLSLPTLRNRDGFKSWLSSISMRVCYDFYRSRKKQKEIQLLDECETAPDIDFANSPNPQNSLQIRENRQKLHQALNELGAEDRMVVQLVHLDGKTVQEAANLLGWTRTNIKIRAFRARAKLKAILEKVVADGFEF